MTLLRCKQGLTRAAREQSFVFFVAPSVNGRSVLVSTCFQGVKALMLYRDCMACWPQVLLKPLPPIDTWFLPRVVQPRRHSLRSSQHTSHSGPEEQIKHPNVSVSIPYITKMSYPNQRKKEEQKEKDNLHRAIHCAPRPSSIKPPIPAHRSGLNWSKAKGSSARKTVSSDPKRSHCVRVRLDW